MPNSSEQPRWRQKEKASDFFIRLIIVLTKYLGRGFGDLILPFISVYYYLAAKEVRQASADYLQTVTGKPVPQRNIIRHIWVFASTILDRVLLFAGRSDYFDVTIQGAPALRQYIDNGRGCLLMLSHLGSFEISRILGEERDLPIKFLMDKAVNAKLLSALERLNPELSDAIIDTAGSDSDRVLRIKNALDKGYIVAIMADRIHGNDQGCEVDFFKRPAVLPVSPWMLAMVLKAPVAIGFGCFIRPKRYHIQFEAFQYPLPKGRGLRTKAAHDSAQQYAKCLEKYAQNYPYNWFNFFPFWQQQHDSSN